MTAWRPISLADVEPSTPPQPSLSGIVYPGGRHLWSGEPESAKSLAADIVILETLRSGGGAILIDLEMGASARRARLQDLGATREELARIAYVEPDAPPSATDIEVTLAAVAARPENTVAVIDAAATAFAVSRLDDHARADVEQFAARWILPLYQAGVASIVIDHVAKARESRGRFAFGSERKVGAVDVHLGFETVKPLRRGDTGLIRITTHKDRTGHLNRPTATELELASAPDTHRITWTWRSPQDGSDGGHWQPTQLMAKVAAYLALRTEPTSRSRIEREVTGQATYVRKAIDELVATGHATEETGSRGARLVTLTRPYTTPSDPVATPSRRGAPVTPSPRLPPTRGTGTGTGSADGVNGHHPVADHDEVERLLRDHADLANSHRGSYG